MWDGEGDLGERLRAMTVTATSPDGAIRATISGDNRLSLRFQPGTYQWYDEHGLSRQLAGLGTTTWVAWTRERNEIIRLASGQSRDESEQNRQQHDDPNRQRFAENLRNLECEGLSTGRWIRITLSGATRWQVQIADGTIRDRSEQAFAAEVVTAFDALIRDRTAKLAILRAEHFDIGVPGSWTRRVREGG
jgi:DNA-binding protein YbaB